MNPPDATELARRKAARERHVDFSDAHELTDDQLQDAVHRRRQRLGPHVKAKEKRVAIQLDEDVLDAFRAQGPGYQQRINEALRLWLLQRENPTGLSQILDDAIELLTNAQAQISMRK